MSKIKDLTDKKFGMLTVIGRADDHVSKNGNKRTAWICRCDCGNELVVMGLNLTRNHTISCGCARKAGRKKLMVDITNQRFGHLVALQPVENNKKGTYWLFHCDCGNNKEMLLQNVKSGKSTTCGCCKSVLGIATQKHGTIGIRSDLTGQRFGRLVAKQRIVNDDMVNYLCKCDCGNTCIKSHVSLKFRTFQNGSNSCGCLQKEAARTNGTKKTGSLIGRKFNHLTVISQSETKYGKLHWLCKCDCGENTIVCTSGLISGHTQSCGCYQDEVASDTHFIDLSGRKFGMLTVIERTVNDSRGNIQYSCLCDCGNRKIIRGMNLSSGNTRSCGCVTFSMGEAIIDDILFDMGIEYGSHIRFDDLTGIGQYPLSYDFGLYSNGKLVGLIEYQGQQHFNSVEYFGGKTAFEKQQFHDELKREYAKETLNVPLLEILYSVRTYDELYKTIESFCRENGIYY